MEKIIIYTDGASRGNPGSSSIGVVFCNKKGEAIKKYSESIGGATNNEAEYRAVIFAFKKAKALFGKKEIKKIEFEIRSDSELLINQLNGEYKVLDSKIQSFFIDIWNLKIDFGRVSFKSIPREENVIADGLANEALGQKNINQRLI